MGALATDTPVTAIYSRRIKPGMIAVFEQWVRDMTALASRRSGYLGVTVLRPSDANHAEYVTILRFASYEQLAAWEMDPERIAFMAKAGGMMVSQTRSSHAEGMELWFTPPLVVAPSSLAPPSAPPRWKMAVLLTGSIFLMSQFLVPLLSPVLGAMPRPLAMLAEIALLVSLVTWVVMPRLTAWLSFWLFR
jgi:antibiotic biosynthesis monooxygenase (ABM) superfamily enzyme